MAQQHMAKPWAASSGLARKRSDVYGAAAAASLASHPFLRSFSAQQQQQQREQQQQRRSDGKK